MKNPNGFGSVSLIGGKKSKKNRRNPYRARVTDRWEWNEEKEKHVQKFRTIGYFPDRKTAMMALAEYNKRPAAKNTINLTFEDIFNLWKEKKFDGISKSGKTVYLNAFHQSEKLHKMKMSDIKTEHLEDVMSGMTVGVSMQKICKTLWNQLFDIAISKDVIYKNYAKFVKTKSKDSSVSKRVPFTQEQVEIMWTKVDEVELIDTALIMIYTGMRPVEMLTLKQENIHIDERYMIGGVKTKAGIDRVIPIHERIVPLIEKVYFKSEPLMRDMETPEAAYKRYYYQNWKKLSETGLIGNATPHYCRHTAVTLMTEAGVELRTIKKIVGHSSGDITDRYTKQSIEYLLQEINKMQ